MQLTTLCLAKVSYDRILSIENLSDVPNPWKGITMNRCLVLALVVLLVSSGVNELHGEYCNHVESLYRPKTFQVDSKFYKACFCVTAIMCKIDRSAFSTV